MKESVTKFDLEAAFKALDEIDIPTAKNGIKANKPALNEIFSRKSKFDSLFEEYYDIGSSAELNDAKEAREAEIAKAKLARIEKIVDLDAKTPEDLLTSYVGKLIIQCPQCMTLFYKNPEDVVESEDDTTTVNVSEVCQHCGNESGYMLIGKVGEVADEEMDEFDLSEVENTDAAEEATEESSEDDTLTVDVDSTEEAAEETTEESEDDFDLDGDIEALDLEVEDDESADEEDEKKEEALSTANEDNILVEQLTESPELETSAEDFEELINSPEFKKPISDTAVRAMMNEFNEEVEKVSADTEAVELEEGIFDKLKDKAADAFDSITGKLKSREAKADWILENAAEDYDKSKITEDGKIETATNNKRFGTFIVIGFKDSYSDGREITKAPSFDNKNLVVGMNRPEVRKTYKEADDYAKGWSMRQGNGPAFIYLAKDATDDRAVFLCEYFKGNLENDNLYKYFEAVKKDLKGAKLMARGVNDDTAEEAKSLQDTDNMTTEEVEASDLKPGMQIEVNGDKMKVKAVGPLKNVKDDSIAYEFVLEVENAEGKDALYNIDKSEKVTVFKESLDSIMATLEEVQEESLEKFISDSLVESYKNVAGFRLKNCSYLDEQLLVEGTIHFTSGKTRETTYTFNESLSTENGIIKLQGQNKKLGLDKKFLLEGKAENKTFITESFKRI